MLNHGLKMEKRREEGFALPYLRLGKKMHDAGRSAGLHVLLPSGDTPAWLERGEAA
jgi:hypothetical protein